jgi:hypothetical protein
MLSDKGCPVSPMTGSNGGGAHNAQPLSNESVNNPKVQCDLNVSMMFLAQFKMAFSMAEW